MDIVTRLRETARGLEPTRIILPEGNDARVIEATTQIRDLGIASITLLGEEEALNAHATELGLSLEDVTIRDPRRDPQRVTLAQRYREARRATALSPAEALTALADPITFGTILVHASEADGLVAGAQTATGRTIEPALHLRRMHPSLGPVASSFIMHLPDRPEFGAEGTFVFTDCALNPEPSPAMLAQIAIAGAHLAETLCGIDPKVALLSFSTLGSATHRRADIVREALAQTQKRAPGLCVDGELQVDAAIVDAVARLKAPQSPVAGQANVLVFPSLEAGNIAYKLVERLAGARAIGPIFTGLNWPINDLSRGCSVDDIIDLVAVTKIMARS